MHYTVGCWLGFPGQQTGSLYDKVCLRGTVATIGSLCTKPVVPSCFELRKLQTMNRNTKKRQLSWPHSSECGLQSSNNISFTWKRCQSFIWLVGMSREVPSSAWVTPSQEEDNCIIGWMVIYTRRARLYGDVRTWWCVHAPGSVHVAHLLLEPINEKIKTKRFLKLWKWNKYHFLTSPILKVRNLSWVIVSLPWVRVDLHQKS